MQLRNYEVEVLVNGHPIREYQKDGKIYIEGRKRNEYSIRIKNNGWKRILAIPTVDGLSVMNGKTASFESSGYIIKGYDSLTIDGWRVSDSEVNKFYFSDSEDSYASKMNRDNNLGVIGVAIFQEKEKVYHHIFEHIIPKQYPFRDWPKDWPFDNPKWYKEDFNNIQLSCHNMQSRGSAMNCNYAKSFQDSGPQDIGTGFGETKESRVITVEFDKETSPDAVFKLFYNTRKQLEKMGINFCDRPQYVTPSAFPNEYCEKPKY